MKLILLTLVTMPEYFIYWKSLITKYVDHGKPIFGEKPNDVVTKLNDEYTGKLIHAYSSDWDSFVKNPNKFYNKL